MTETAIQNALVAGVTDLAHCRAGWYDRARDGRMGLLFRPTGPKAHFDLDLPGGDIEIIALLSAGVSLCGGRFSGRLEMKTKNAGAFILETELWTTRRFYIKNAPRGKTPFAFVADNPYVPNDVLKNGDFREMGVNVAAVRIQPAEKKEGAS